MPRLWLTERRKRRALLAAKAATDDGPMCPIEVYVPITSGGRDRRGILPGTDEEQAVLFELRDQLAAHLHERRIAVVPSVDFERGSAYVYLWGNDPRLVLREISPILARFPTVERVRFSEADFKDLGDAEPEFVELRPPF